MSDVDDSPDEHADYVQPDPGAVEAVHDQLVGWSGEERARTDAINQRASWLLGFCAVILGLAAGQANEVFKDSPHLGSFGRVFAAAALALAFVAVAVAAFFSLRALILARSGPKEVAIDDDEVANALSDQNLLATKSWNQLRNAQVVQQQIPAQRFRNKASASALWKAFIALLVGVTLLVAYAGVFVENAVEASSCSTAEVRPLVAQVGGQSRALTVDSLSTVTTEANLAAGEAQAQRIVVIKPPCPKTITVP